MSNRIRRTPEQWRQICQQQQESGLSVQHFCSEHGVSYASFCKWRRKMKPSATSEPSSLIDLSAFVAPAAPTWDIEVDLGSGMTLRMRRSVQ